MHNEHNRESLKRALEQLRQYDPPASAWEGIRDGLSTEAKPTEEVLHTAVGKLPQHAPPPTVWNQLNQVLDKDTASRRLRVVRRRTVLRYAAAVAILVSATWWVLYEPGPRISLQYAQEEMQDFSPKVDWNNDAEAFAKLEARLREVNNPAINRLRAEYEELNSAHREVESILTSYGRDPQLIRQMADIERERSDLYRQLIESL